MPRKQDQSETPESGVLAAAARTVGKAAGKVAAAVAGNPDSPAPVAPPAPRTSTKIPKLAPKNKSRLPRRLKKAQRKAAQPATSN